MYVYLLFIIQQLGHFIAIFFKHKSILYIKYDGVFAFMNTWFNVLNLCLYLEDVSA